MNRIYSTQLWTTIEIQTILVAVDDSKNNRFISKYSFIKLI